MYADAAAREGEIDDVLRSRKVDRRIRGLISTGQAGVREGGIHVIDTSVGPCTRLARILLVISRTGCSTGSTMADGFQRTNSTYPPVT